MAKLQILDIVDDKYSLIDIESKKVYTFNLKFYGLANNPKIDDTFGFHDELLDPNYPEYSQTYQFGPLDEVYGREVTSAKDIDCIVLFTADKKIFLKRFFG